MNKLNQSRMFNIKKFKQRNNKEVKMKTQLFFSIKEIKPVSIHQEVQAKKQQNLLIELETLVLVIIVVTETGLRHMVESGTTV